MEFEKKRKKQAFFALLEVLLVAMVLLGLLRFQWRVESLVYSEMALAVVYLALLALGVFGEFKEDKFAFVVLFGVLLLIVQAAVFLVFTSEGFLAGFNAALMLAVSLLAFVLFFKAFFSKGKVKGRVILCDSENAAIEIPFDIFSGVREGKYVVETNRKYGKGETVKVKIGRKLFGKEPVAITGKAEQ